MKLELEFFNALCSTSVFKINGIAARSSDFGTQRDCAPDEAEDYACGDMQFKATGPSAEVLFKYNITEAEYNIISGQLEAGLSFGNCGLCV